MGFVKNIRNYFLSSEEIAVVEEKAQANYGTMMGSFAVSFDGEKNLGEIGPIKDYNLNYDALRLRS